MICVYLQLLRMQLPLEIPLLEEGSELLLQTLWEKYPLSVLSRMFVLSQVGPYTALGGKKI